MNLIRFSTQYTDDETDLVCYLHRYYNPNTGRWLSRDPIGEKGGFNVYGFALNDPENRIDPLGLHDCPAWAEYMTQHPPSEQTLEFMEAEAVVIGLLSPWPGDEGVAGATLAKKLKDCIGKCKNIRCMVRWHGKHHPFGGVKKCHLEFQCYVKGKSGKPNTIHIPLPDSLCPPWDSPQK